MIRMPILALLAAAVLAAPQARAETFRATLDAHLAAIQSKNLDALIPTLTPGPDLTLIMPDGTKLDTRKQFIDLHRAWFSDANAGRWEGEVVKVVEAGDQAVALIRYRYGDKGAQQVSVSWLTLTFARKDGRWGLVFDQNTRIRMEPVAP